MPDDRVLGAGLNDLCKKAKVTQGREKALESSWPFDKDKSGCVVDRTGNSSGETEVRNFWKTKSLFKISMEK